MSEIRDSELIARASSILKPVRVKGRLFGDVGAAVLSEAGDVFTGVAVDTAGWGLCAERSALAAMITAGQYRIAKVVAVWRDENTGKLHVLPPCGICREFMRSLDEGNLAAQVITGRDQSVPLSQLLPLHEWSAAEPGDGPMSGRIIFLNGTSSSGKTTLARALRSKLPPSFCYYASDQLADAGFRPLEPEARSAGREMFFDAFHRSIPAMASAGVDLLVEHIVEEQRWADDLAALLAALDVFWVGVHAPVDVISAREVQRGDRTIGEAAYHLRTHSFCRYGWEVDTTRPTDDIAAEIVTAWHSRRSL